MAGIGDLIAGLFGGGGGSAKFVPAPPLASYPSSEDAANALKYGFGQGNPRMDGHVTGQAARVLGEVSQRRGGPEEFTPRSGANIDLRQLTAASDVDAAPPGRLGEAPVGAPVASSNRSPAPFGMSDVFARAALASNRIPIAALGFDPSRMVADTKLQNPTIGGAYSRRNDGIYFTMPEGRPPSTPVHESIHRGMNMLRQDPANAEICKTLPGEETVVRYLMAKHAGDPEKGAGPVGTSQRNFALELIDGGGGAHHRRGIAALTTAAEEAIKNRRPGGPR